MIMRIVTHDGTAADVGTLRRGAGDRGTEPPAYLGEFCFRSELRKDPETALWTLLGLLARG